MSVIKVTTMNNNDVMFENIENIVDANDSIKMILMNILTPNVEHSYGLDENEIRLMDDVLMAVTNVHKGLVFRIVRDNRGFGERVIIADGHLHSISFNEEDL